MSHTPLGARMRAAKKTFPGSADELERLAAGLDRVAIGCAATPKTVSAEDAVAIWAATRRRWHEISQEDPA